MSAQVASQHGGFGKAARRTLPTKYEEQAFKTERKAQLLAFQRGPPPLDEVDRFMLMGVGAEAVGSTGWKGTHLRASGDSVDNVTYVPTQKPLPSHAAVMGSLTSTHGILHSNCFGGGRIESPTRSPSAIHIDQPWATQGLLGGQSLTLSPSREHFHRPTIFGEAIEASFRMNMPMFGNVIFKKA